MMEDALPAPANRMDLKVIKESLRSITLQAGRAWDAIEGADSMECWQCLRIIERFIADIDHQLERTRGRW